MRRLKTELEFLNLYLILCFYFPWDSSGQICYPWVIMLRNYSTDVRIHQVQKRYFTSNLIDLICLLCRHTSSSQFDTDCGFTGSISRGRSFRTNEFYLADYNIVCHRRVAKKTRPAERPAERTTFGRRLVFDECNTAAQMCHFLPSLSYRRKSVPCIRQGREGLR